MNRSIAMILLASLVFFAHQLQAEYPGDSIYQLNSQWTNQDSEETFLQELAGSKIVLSMTYTSCQHTCPTIVSNMQALENRLSEEELADVRFVLVSLMPEVDTPEVLKAYEKKRDLKNWVLLSGEADDVRTLAMVLNVKYKPAGETEISHSNLITILDPEGRIAMKIQGVNPEYKGALETLQK